MLSVPSSAATVAPEGNAATIRPAPVRGARRKLWFFAALSAFVGMSAATLLHGRSAVSSDVRSGIPGFRKSSTGIDQHWKVAAVTVYLDPSLGKLGPGGDEAVIQAFGQWVGRDERLPNLSFDRGGTSSDPKHDGKSTVSFGPIKLAGHERDLAITVTYSDDKTGEILEADMVLNSLYPMGVLTPKGATEGGQGKGDDTASNGPGNEARKAMVDEAVDCRNRYDAQNIATHEAGHFFGLGEDLTERTATMFLSIDQCETHKRELATTDVSAIGTLYGQVQSRMLDGQAPTVATAPTPDVKVHACSYGSAPVGGTTLFVSVAIAGLALSRRRR
jgi:hypothetical protein